VKFSLAVIFIPIFKEDDAMATAKYTKGKDGYYQAKVWDGTYTEAGVKHRVTLRTKKSSRALEEMVRELEEKVRNRDVLKESKVSVQDYARTWLNIYKHDAELNTKAMYRHIIEVHMDILKAVPISALRKTDVLLCLNAASGKLRTQEQILLTLKQVVKAAVTDKHIAPGVYMEIFDGIRIKKQKNTDKRPLTPEEKAAVFSAEFTNMQKAFVYVIYGCGLRRGEALALERPDFDFEGKKLSINKALAFDKNTPYIKSTKSQNGIREVPIPSSVLPFLREYCNCLPQSRLFYTAGKNIMTKSSYVKLWAGIQQKMNSPDLTAHIFRHNYCTNLCYQIPTVSIKKIAELLGDHEKMVIEVYNHIILEKEDAEKAVELALSIRM